jgi:DNA-binding transcriptional MerR regulator
MRHGRFPVRVRIGELAREVGVATDTVRFYERSGWLPRPSRRENAYREYDEQDVEHLRLLIELRRLDVPLADAARIAGWCHSGHCAETTAELPTLIAERRVDIARRLDGLRALDDQLAALARHLDRQPSAVTRSLAMIEPPVPCCAAADAVVGSATAGCACCARVSVPS